MIRNRYRVPIEICDSQIIEIVATEPNQLGLRECRVEGPTIYWCETVVDGRPYGRRFAASRDEIDSWELIKNPNETRTELTSHAEIDQK